MGPAAAFPLRPPRPLRRPAPPAGRSTSRPPPSPDGATLTVAVNGATIGTYNKYAHSGLEGFLRPGPNTIALTFSAPGTATTGASLHCLPPLPVTLRSIILELHPTGGQLRAETTVVLSGG
jgi:hypothetical protein